MYACVCTSQILFHICVTIRCFFWTGAYLSFSKNEWNIYPQKVGLHSAEAFIYSVFIHLLFFYFIHSDIRSAWSAEDCISKWVNCSCPLYLCFSFRKVYMSIQCVPIYMSTSYSLHTQFSNLVTRFVSSYSPPTHTCGNARHCGFHSHAADTEKRGLFMCSCEFISFLELFPALRCPGRDVCMYIFLRNMSRHGGHVI